ncbi:MAG: hypothetical protein AB1349_07105 [Elusimicrobiota bacterium]
MLILKKDNLMQILADELAKVKGLDRAEWEKWDDVKTEEQFWGDLKLETHENGDGGNYFVHSTVFY